MTCEDAAKALVIVADEQTAGRGRYFSLLLRPGLAVEPWPLIIFMAAPAVGDVLHEAAGVERNIKWPNNLLSGERKICGVLAEAIETAGGRAVTMIVLKRLAYATAIKSYSPVRCVFVHRGFF